MSYSAGNPASPAPPARPGVVTAAGYLLYLAAAVLLIDALLPLTSMNKVIDVYKEVYAGTADASSVPTAARIGMIISVVLYVLIAAGMCVLAAFDLRGSKVSRIITWVVAGLGVLCFGCGVASTGLGSSITSSMNTKNVNGVDAAELARRVKDAQPSWLVPTSITFKVIGLLAVIAVIILLSLPAANVYFRGNSMEVPSYAEVPYPAYPSYPTTTPDATQGGLPGYPAAPPAPGTGQVPPGEQPPGGQPPVQQ